MSMASEAVAAVPEGMMRLDAEGDRLNVHQNVADTVRAAAAACSPGMGLTCTAIGLKQIVHMRYVPPGMHALVVVCNVAFLERALWPCQWHGCHPLN
jgi:hypothetical protein